MDNDSFDQQVELERIRQYSSNGIPGEQIVQDLLDYPSLWTAVWMEGDLYEAGTRKRVRHAWHHPDWRPDVLDITASDRDSASRLLELAACWRSDGFDMHEHPWYGWGIGGWWD